MQMNNEKKIILFTFVAHYFFHFYELAFPALAIPLMLSLKMSLEDVLKLGFPMYLLFGLFSLPWGMFADRFGNRRTLIIFFFGTGLGAVVTALSSTGASIMLSLALIGFFAGIYHPAGMGLISLGVRNRGMALGINGVAGSIGLASAPFIAGFLNWLVGWKMAYLLLGLVGILWGLLMFFVPIDETPIERGTTGQAAKREENSRSALGRFLILCVIVTLGGLAYRINIVVLPAYLEFKAGFLARFFAGLPFSNMSGMTTMAAGILVSFVYIVGIFGQLTGGKMADRRDLLRLYLSFNLWSLPFVVLMSVLGEQFLVAAACLYVFFALGIQPIENSLVASFTPDKWRSTGYGITSILIFGVGSFAVYWVGWIKEAWSLGAVYLVSGGLIVLILAGIVGLIRYTKGYVCRNRDSSKGC
jgi:MFS transporter, FSR family, fosmidomycin resistance protein